MRSPLAAWRSGVRWPLALIALLVALVVVVGVCEAIGWPFLVGPAQQRLAAMLERRVVFGDDPDRSSGVRIGLLGSVRVSAASIEIGAPSWSDSGHTVLARDARLKLGYGDLWRAYRGGNLHIRELEASGLDARLERRKDGRASWQFGTRKPDEPKANDEPAALPTFGRLVVGDGHVVYDDEVLPAAVDVRFALSDRSNTAATGLAASSAALPASAARAASGGIAVRAGGAAGGNLKTAESVRLAPGESGLRLKAVGHYRQLPVNIDLGTSGVLGLLGQGADARAQPLSLRAVIARTELSFDGTTTDPLHFAALKGRFKLAGPTLSTVGEVLGITLPATPPFKTEGTLAKDNAVWKAVFESASIGSSRLNGAFTYDTGPDVPLLAGRLGGSRLLLADLGPAIGTPPSGSGTTAAAEAVSGRVIPDKRFDLPSLRAMNANVLVYIAMLDSGTEILEPLRPGRAHILLADGVLTIANFEGVTAQGTLAGYVQLDGRGPQALWTADLRLRGVNLAQWLKIKRSGDAPPYLSGKLDVLVKVKGEGRSAAEILASLDGDVRMRMREAQISHLALEAAGIDVAQALGLLVKGDAGLSVQCNAIALDVVDGVIKPKVFVINTRDSTIWLDGTVSLRDESLDLRAVTAPKDFSPMSLRTPVRVRGTFSNPAVSLELGKLAGKAAAAGLLSLLNPLAALIPFIDPGDKKDAAASDSECAALARSAGAMSAAVRTPESARVPPDGSASPDNAKR